MDPQKLTVKEIYYTTLFDFIKRVDKGGIAAVFCSDEVLNFKTSAS